RIGLSRAVSSVGAFASLVSAAPLCLSVGPHQMFTIYGLLGLAAFPLALALALAPSTAAPAEARAPRRWIPSDLNTLFFVLAVAVIAARALLTTVSPVLAAQRSPDRIGALASFATWSDVGLAAGAFLGTVGISALGLIPVYATLAVLVAGTALFQHARAGL